MRRVVLQSSMFASLAYDDEQQFLDVEFTSGRRYRYFDVPEILFAALLKATSKGRFFNDRIRDSFPSSRL